MIRKGLTMLALVLMLPMGAHAYFLSTTVSKCDTTASNGTLQYGANAAQTSGTVSRSVSGAQTIHVTAATNYTISKYQVNTAPVVTTAGDSTDIPVTSTGASQVVNVWFAKKLTSVTAVTDGGGSVSPSGTLNLQAGTVKTYTFTPPAGGSVYAVTGLSGTYSFDNTPPYAGAVTLTLTVPSGNTTITGKMASVTANAGTPQTVMLNTGDVALNGSATVNNAGTASYAWTQIAGPAVTLAGATTATPSFPSTTAGSYTFKLAVTAGGATSSANTTVTVTNSATDAARNQCVNCHTNAGVGTAVYANWSTSVHASKTVMCATCHVGANTGSHPGVAVSTIVCATCHAGDDSAFRASRHWTSATGHETAADFIAAGHGDVASCAQKCHFNQGGRTGCFVCHNGSIAADGSLVGASDSHSVAAPTSETTCMACHEGGRHGVPTYNWGISTHNKANQPPYIQEEAACADCHDPHSTDAVASNGKTDSCAKCHKYVGPTADKNYGLYSSNGNGRAPHFGGVASSGLYTDGTQKTQLIGNGMLCIDCHGHNNTINAGYAEGGHGEVSDKGLNPFAHYDWSARLNDGSRSQSNCDRCHTTSGFLLLVGDTTNGNRVKPIAGQPSNPLACITCHNAPVYDGTLAAPYGWAGVAGKLLPEGRLRINETPAGSAAGALKNGYFALFSSNTATLGAGNTKFQVQFPGYKNSAICVPCHAGRTTVAYVNQKLATIANYSTLQGADYQHAKNMGQSFIGVGAYDYTGNAAKVGVSAHSAVKMATGDSQGPCVGCHYSSSAKTHSLEVDATSATCAACHTTTPNVAAAQANYQAGLKALDALIRFKCAPLWAKGSTDLGVERDGYFRFARLGVPAGTPVTRLNGQNGYGAWYNWQLLSLWDSAAFVHNPAYARVILNDTLEFLYNGYTAKTDPSYKAADYIIANINTIASPATPLTAGEITGAGTFGSGSALGCIGCHAVGQQIAGFVDDNTGVRAVVAEFNDPAHGGTRNSHHVTGKTLTNADCAVCHMEGTVAGGVNPAYHMKDAKIHLRNGNKTVFPTTNNPADNNEFVWNPASPDHTAMDNFCMSCHNSAGATAAVGIVAGNSATNPFADTISNGYDQMSRSTVVAVYEQFDTGNAAHHAVRGQKYNTRTSGFGGPAEGRTAAFTQYSGATADGKYPGSRKTIYEAGLFVSTYTPLGAASNVGDDSTLHCGDCHTVGQWTAGNSTNKIMKADGTFTTQTIGAHGSVNEYMLRTSIGTDQLHKQTDAATTNNGTYVCFLCHSATAASGYGDGSAQHANLHTGGSGCNSQKMDSTGRTGSLRVGPAPAQGGTPTNNSTVFGMVCSNCHNSGNRVFGGIHGGNGGLGGGFEVYSTAGANSATDKTFAVVNKKPYRFMFGTSLKYNGGGSADKWESKTLTGAHREGCYNLTTSNTADGQHFWTSSNTPVSTNAGSGGPAGTQAEASTAQNNGTVAGSWGACGHHVGSTSSSSTAPARNGVQRPLSY